MPTHKRDTAIDAVTGSAASGAALFVTFYIARDRASSLYKQLHPFTQTAELTRDRGQAPAGKLLLGQVEPPAAHDATAIRLILNAPGDAAAAWETMRQQLSAILDALDSCDDWWGYTVTYQAVLDGEGSMDSAFGELLPAVRRVDSSDSLKPLAIANLSGGRVWLVDVPQEGNGRAAATICVALSPPDVEGAFKKVLLGPRLLMVDLIAHKGYFLKRQYRGKLQQDYREQLKVFWGITDDLLGHLSQQGRLRQEPRSTDKLNRLTRIYKVLVSIVSKLNRMSVSMSQQLYNYEPWRTQMEGNGLVEYHYGHLGMGKQDLDLMVAQGKDALEVANTAMSITQVELDKELERRQSLIGYLLAAVGAGLAVPELFNHDVAKAFVGEALQRQVPPADEISWLAFLMQLVAIAVTAVVIAILAHGIYRLRAWWRATSERR